MEFNYEQSVWGNGEASERRSHPASFRLRQSFKALATLPPHAAVLEVGCGAGQFIRAVRQIKPELVCHGCDISKNAIAQAKKYADGVVYALSDPRQLPYADNSFDAALIFDVLEHVDNVPIILREVRRVLKNRGVFYCYVPCEGDNLSWWRWLRDVGIGIDLTKKYAGHINYFSRASLIKILDREGFVITRLRYSEHVLGQMLGVASFIAMDRASRRAGRQQINNESYFTQLGKNTWWGAGMDLARRVVNSLVYWESRLLERIPSPNIHITSRSRSQKIIV